MQLNAIDKDILRIALPAVVSNVTVPLLGLADTAIVGHLGHAAYIGAIAVGSMVFSILYWLFGFLRAGTSGFTAQALGAGRAETVVTALYRSLLFAFVVACAILLLQRPVFSLALHWVDASPQVAEWAQVYFSICVWGAPAVLMLYGFNGWFIGMQDTRRTMTIALVQNVVNVLLSVLFVFGLGMKVAGVALGTLLSQYVGLGLAVGLWLKYYPRYVRRERLGVLLQGGELRRFFTVNRDIFLRTLCIIAVTSFFTTSSAWQGDAVLAGNTILLQLFYLFSFFIDGFANAGESLAGHCHGARDAQRMERTVERLFRWGLGLAAVFTLVYAAGAEGFLRLMTNDREVTTAVAAFTPEVVVIPLLSFAAFLWDGVFIGVTSMRRMFLSMLIATVLFFAFYGVGRNHLGGHALWMAFCLYLFARGAAQTVFYRAIRREERERAAK